VNAVKKAFKQVEDMLTTDASTVATQFSSCKALDTEIDQVNFLSSLMGVFQGIVQYNSALQTPSIQSVCQIMTSGENLIELLVKVTVQTSSSCVDYSYQGMLDKLLVTKVDPNNPVGDRQWYFQTCTQFGYYQTCEGEDCIFSQKLNLDFNVAICDQLFGFSSHNVQERINFSNDYYGSDQPRSSRIVFVNGMIDPWHAISVVQDLDEMPAILIPGASHCENMGSASSADTAVMTDAKNKIADLVQKWLNL